MSPIPWVPELIDELVAHGWNRGVLATDDSRSPTRFDNEKFRHVAAIAIRGSNVSSWSADSRGGTRIKLYVRELKYPYADVNKRLPSLTLCTTNPRWRRSLTRWMTTIIMHLTEHVWQKEDAEAAAKRREEKAQRDKLATLLAPVGITPEQFNSRLRVSWWPFESDDPPPTIANVRPLEINPARNKWNGETQVTKAARLLLFLHQENWINLDEETSL